MLSRFQQGTIEDFVTLEEVFNGDICVVDKVTNKIRKPVDIDEYLLNQLVLVYDWHRDWGAVIPLGEQCRCWHTYLVL